MSNTSFLPSRRASRLTQRASLLIRDRVASSFMVRQSLSRVARFTGFTLRKLQGERFFPDDLSASKDERPIVTPSLKKGVGTYFGPTSRRTMVHPKSRTRNVMNCLTNLGSIRTPPSEPRLCPVAVSKVFDFSRIGFNENRVGKYYGKFFKLFQERTMPQRLLRKRAGHGFVSWFIDLRMVGWNESCYHQDRELLIARVGQFVIVPDGDMDGVSRFNFANLIADLHAA